MAYELAPWVVPPNVDLARDYLSGLETGAGIAHQQAALQQSAQEAALRSTLEQQRIRQESMQEQQRQQVQKAYYDQLHSQEMQRLTQEQQMNQLKIQDAMRQMNMQQTYQQRISAGEDPNKVLLELGPGMGIGGGALSEVLRVRNPEAVSPLGKLQADWLAAKKRGDTASATQLEAYIRDAIEREKKQSTTAQRFSFRTDPNTGKWFRENLSTGEVEEVQPKGTPAAPGTDQILPMPTDFSKAEVGKRYQTASGPMYWTGTGFSLNPPGAQFAPTLKQTPNVVGGTPAGSPGLGVAEDAGYIL